MLFFSLTKKQFASETCHFSVLNFQDLIHLFGFLFLVFAILVIACSQISIVMVYFQLCAEDYHWWWRSFIVSGGSAFYVFLYSVFYFYTKLEITHFVPTLLYFCYTFVLVLTFWVLTGTIGFYAAYIFIRKIYSQIKIDQRGRQASGQTNSWQIW